MAVNKILGNIFKGDRVVWLVFFFLCIISAIEVFSASSALTYKGGSYFSPIIKHVGILILGIVLMLVTTNIQCRYFRILIPDNPNMGIFCRPIYQWCAAMDQLSGHTVSALRNW